MVKMTVWHNAFHLYILSVLYKSEQGDPYSVGVNYMYP